MSRARTVLSASLVLFGAISSALASDDAGGRGQGDAAAYPSYGIQINPLTPILGAARSAGAADVEFQMAFHDYVGLSIVSSFVWKMFTFDDTDVYGYGVEVRLGPRIFPEGRRLDGTYVLAFVRYLFVGVSTDNNSDQLQVVGPGLEAGYAWTWTNGFSINLGLGTSYDFYWYSDGPDGVPMTIMLNFTLGYVW